MTVNRHHLLLYLCYVFFVLLLSIEVFMPVFLHEHEGEFCLAGASAGIFLQVFLSI